MLDLQKGIHNTHARLKQRNRYSTACIGQALCNPTLISFFLSNHMYTLCWSLGEENKQRELVFTTRKCGIEEINQAEHCAYQVMFSVCSSRRDSVWMFSSLFDYINILHTAECLWMKKNWVLLTKESHTDYTKIADKFRHTTVNNFRRQVWTTFPHPPYPLIFINTWYNSSRVSKVSFWNRSFFCTIKSLG